MARIGLIAIVIVAAVTAIVFAVAPRLDLNIAMYFHHYQASDAAQRINPVFAFLRDVNYKLVILAVVLPVIAFVIKLAWPKWPMLVRPRAAILMIVAMLVGPGLIVNGILKDQWARPRPGEVVEFGGPLAFMPWYKPGGECRSNCSFVSGESATAFWLLAPAAAVPPPWTVPAVVGAAVWATAVAFTRVFTTGHFFTDAVFAAALVSFVVWLLHGILFRWTATAITDAAIERAMERWVYAVRRPFIALGSRFNRRPRKDARADG